jgi:hypothetical protein
VSDQPRISVVTPSFNQGRYVGATLQSVLSQRYDDLEYVVIDGGSTDGSVDLIRAHEADLTHWVSEPDRGHANAVNKGFAHTTGEIMCWLNSSDLYYPWTFSTVAAIFSALPEVQWIQGLPTQFAESEGPCEVGSHAFNVYDILAGQYRWIQQESVFWRRGLWERAGGGLDESLRYAADFDLWLRFFRHAPLYHAGTILGGFRIHGDRLGAPERYIDEAETCFAAFRAEQDARTLRRAGLVKVAGLGRGYGYVTGRALNKLGVWSWYRHPRALYDFTADRWVAK